jgi:DNA-binding MarR family transcriptional regulator
MRARLLPHLPVVTDKLTLMTSSGHDHDSAAQPDEVTAALLASLSLIYRRLREPRPEGELTLPESAALSWLSREGPMTAAELARKQQITPQSIAHTLQGLEQRGLVARAADPSDGRRVILSLTAAGLEARQARRQRRDTQLQRAVAETFDEQELKTLLSASKLLERLAEVKWQ